MIKFGTFLANKQILCYTLRFKIVWKRVSKFMIVKIIEIENMFLKCEMINDYR